MKEFVSREVLSTTGIQSSVDVGEYAGFQAIRKVAGRGLQEETLHTLLEATVPYRQSLFNAGLSVPEPYAAYVVNGAIETIDQYITGRDIDMLLRTDDPNWKRAWQEMVLQLAEAANDTKKSKAMIDAKPGNFVLNGQLWYVDTFPPMLRGADGLINPWVYEVYKRERGMMSFNFGDMRGQLVKLLAGSRITYPTHYQEIVTLTEECLPAFPEPTQTYVKDQIEKDFPDMKSFYAGQDMTERLNEL